MYPFEWNPGHLLDSAKIHPPSGNFQEDSLPASFVLIYGNLKVKHSPAWRSIQRPGKTHSTAHDQWTLSSLSTPPLRGSHCPKSRCLDPRSAQPSALVRGSPRLPPDDTNQDDIWIALLFDMTKPQLCADFPSCEYSAAVFKKDWQKNVWLTPERLKTLRSEYVVYWEKEPRFASSHSASFWIPCLQPKARRRTLTYAPFSQHYFALEHME